MGILDFLFALPELLIGNGLQYINPGSKVLVELGEDESLTVSIFQEEK